MAQRVEKPTQEKKKRYDQIYELAQNYEEAEYEHHPIGKEEQEKSKYIIKRRGEATTNLGFRVETKAGQTKEGIGKDEKKRQKKHPKVYFVRIFGKGTELLYDRQRELQVMLGASKYNLGPKLYAQYDNGIISQFLKGRPLQVEELRNIEISKKIMAELARWHSIEPRLVFEETFEQYQVQDCFHTLFEWEKCIDRLMKEFAAGDILRSSVRRNRAYA